MILEYANQSTGEQRQRERQRDSWKVLWRYAEYPWIIQPTKDHCVYVAKLRLGRGCWDGSVG